MSRTKRKDRIDVETPLPDMMMSGRVYSFIPTKKQLNKAHRDKKKWYKPNKKFKKNQRKKDAAKPKQKLVEAIKHGADFDNVVLPDTKRTDCWDWN